MWISGESTPNALFGGYLLGVGLTPTEAEMRSTHLHSQQIQFFGWDVLPAEGNAEQTEEVIFSIRASIALLPAGAIAVSFLIMLFYPLTDAKFAQIMKEITARRAAKAAEDPETQAAINAVTASQAPQSSQA